MIANVSVLKYLDSPVSQKPQIGDSADDKTPTKKGIKRSNLRAKD